MTVSGGPGGDHRLEALLAQIAEQLEVEGIEPAAAQAGEIGRSGLVPGPVDRGVVVRPDRQEFHLPNCGIEFGLQAGQQGFVGEIGFIQHGGDSFVGLFLHQAETKDESPTGQRQGKSARQPAAFLSA